MANQNCDILFEYLRSILYDSTVRPIDIQNLDPEFQKLGMGLQFLDHAIQEMKQCSAALSKGNLSEFKPSRDNFLCDNLKNIHANLEHLTWQAKQVAKGDYSQHVSYLGEFSKSFNSMTEQLKEREEQLKSEAELEKKHADTVFKYNQLLLELIHHSNDDILVTDLDQSQILYSSHNRIRVEQENEILKYFYDNIHKSDEWNLQSKDNRYYHIVSINMEWQNNLAYAHFIHDITLEKQEHDKLHKEAHLDALTQVNNRYAFTHEMNEILNKHEYCTIVYCDLDHLKYVNDTFGHEVGDQYILDFVHCLKTHIRSTDSIARLGGDEFCLIFKDSKEKSIEQKMKIIYKDFNKETGPFIKSFSYGIISIDTDNSTLNSKQILQIADQKMYAQKRKRKMERKG